MEYTEIAPSPPLSAIVRCFWFLRGNVRDEPAEPQTIVPDGRLEIVLHLADPFGKLDGHGVVEHQGPVLLSGQLTAPIRLLARGETDIVGIRFRTAAARTVIGAPLHELTDRVGALGDVAPPLTRALSAAAARHVLPEARADALTAVLLRFVRHAPDPIAEAVVHTFETNDAPRIDAVARTLGVSTRTLERKVLEHSGLPPSVLRRVVRFRRTFRMLDTASPGTWGKIAISAGFFDQAHLIRDFREFAGAAPGDFFRDRIELARAILTSSRSARELQ